MRNTTLALALTLAAAPCLAATEVAPPMTITRIDGRSVDPLTALHESDPGSMIIDAVVQVMLNVHGVTSPSPPPKFDRPYANAEIVFDLPGVAGEAWGLTEPPTHKGGRCVVHLAPLGSAVDDGEGGIEFLEPVGLPRLIRHEMGHCNGLAHTVDDPDRWAEVPDADRAKVAAVARREWLRLTGQSDVAPAPARPAVTSDGRTPKPHRNVAPNTMRSFSGDGH